MLSNFKRGLKIFKTCVFNVISNKGLTRYISYRGPVAMGAVGAVGAWAPTGFWKL